MVLFRKTGNLAALKVAKGKSMKIRHMCGGSDPELTDTRSEKLAFSQ